MTVIVTGANGEIGQAICENLYQKNYSVIAVTRTPYPELNKSSNQNGSISNFVTSDLSNETAIHDLLQSITSESNHRIGLVYAAAVFERIKDFREVTSEVWDKTLEVNLKDAYVWNKLIADFAIKHQSICSIVNVTSQAWMTGGYGQVIAYASSKGGLVTMTKSLARVVAKDKIRVNCVAPGFIDTKSMRGDLDENGLLDFLSAVPMGRLGTTQEVSDAIAFLISEDSKYITGITLAVTGGQLMH